MRIRRLTASVGTMILSMAALVLVPGSPAQAATTVFCTQPGAHAGYGCFWSNGDIIGVNDMLKDGLRTVVEWVTDDNGGGECHDANGANNGWTYCNYDFTEGTNKTIAFRTVARDGANGADKYPTVTVIGWISGRG